MDQTWYTIETNVDGAVRLQTVTVRITLRQVTVSSGTMYERRFPVDVWNAQQLNGSSVYGLSPAVARDRFVARLKRELDQIDAKRIRTVRQLAAAESVRLS